MPRLRAVAVPAVVVALAALLPVADLLFARPPHARAKGKKVALLIGVNTYTKRGLDNLQYAEPDVVALAKELTDAGFEVTTIRGGDGIDPAKKVTGKDVYFAALTERLRGVGKADTVLLAFSGHGAQLEVDKKESPYFCPADGVPTDAGTLISLNDVLKELDAKGGGHNLVLVDACRNVVDANRGARGGINGSRIDNLPEGTAVFFSCSGRQKARETDKMFPAEKGKKGHGVFFHFVLTGLRGAPGATDAKGRVTWDRLVPFVKEQVKEANADWFAEVKEEERQIPFAIGSLGDVPPLVSDQAKKPGDGKTYTSKATGMKFVRIKAGPFQMGSPKDEKDRSGDEEQHDVTLTKDYFLGVYEVTRGQFRKFVEDEGYKTEGESDGTGGYGWDAAKKTWVKDAKFTWKNPGFPQTDDHPVVLVSWNDAVAFCNWQSKKDGLPASYEKKDGQWVPVVNPRGYRLPSEAEWEFACRAGGKGRFHFGDDDETLVQYGNVADADFRAATGIEAGIKASDGYGFTAPVGKYKANPWGLHDMHGNAWEWCEDYYGPYNKLASSTNPLQLTKQSDDRRVLRGGSWGSNAWYCRAAYRSVYAPDDRFNYGGFRVCVRLD